MDQIKIFVILGSQKFQMNRLLEQLDKISNNEKYNIFAQIGYSTYKPINYNYVKFLDNDLFQNKILQADLILTHAGTGAIVSSLKKNKKVIAVPRLAKFKEHVDDHQLEIAKVFYEKQYINTLLDVSELEKCISETMSHTYNNFESNTSNFIDKLMEIIENE